MKTSVQRGEIERLEQAFWKSMLESKPEVATSMLTEPALMVSGHGANKFDHAGYMKMARDDRFKLVDYDISKMDVTFPREDVAVASYQVSQKVEMEGKTIEMDVFDTSTWVKIGGDWRCAMHTECPVARKPG
jgi:hypothetical protein